MKNRIFKKFGLGLTVAVLPLAGGCLQQSNPPPPGYESSTFAPLASDNPGTALAASVEDASPMPPAEAAVDPAAAPAKVVAPALEAPPSVRFTPAAGEIVRMADSGLGESVMLAYVTNAAGAFDLKADEIIYLNDIGVPATVVSAMIQHDGALRQSAAQPIAVPAAASANVAAVPAPADSNPAVAQVAPQFSNPNAYALPPALAAEPVPAPPTEDSSAYFYDTLSPYGNWIEVEGYGRCWQPTVVVANPAWRPYMDNGYWAYTDCGWYWVSDYSWGWAPFHYGRWFHHNHFGWCWAPDRVWGPSWVTWRYTDAYCGWAPLPPGAWYSPGFGLTYYGNSVAIGFSFGLAPSCFSFVSFNHFCDRNVHYYCVPHDEAEHRIYPTSVAVNRIIGGNNVVINRGIEPAQVTRVTKSEVRRLSIVDSRTPPVRGGRNESVDPARNALVVYRPGAAALATTTSRGNLRSEVSRRSGSAPAAPSAALTPDATQPAASVRGESRPAYALTPGTASGAASERPNRPASASRPATPLTAPKATTTAITPSAVPAASTPSPTAPSPAAVTPRARSVPDRTPAPALPTRPATAPAPTPTPPPMPTVPMRDTPSPPIPNRSLPGPSAASGSPMPPTRPMASAPAPAVSPAPRAEAPARPFSSPTPPSSAPARFEPPARAVPAVSAPPASAPVARPAAPVMAPPPPPAYSAPAPAMAASRPSPPPSAPATTPPAPASTPSPSSASSSTPARSGSSAADTTTSGRR
jgi:hypothetical protein